MWAKTYPWTCQLLDVSAFEDGLLLDLVAMEPCPYPDVTVASGTPFVVRFIQDSADCATFAQSWAEDMAMVNISLVDAEFTRWLYISGPTHQIVLEVMQ